MIVTRPGVYNFNCLRFQIRDTAKTELLSPSEEENGTLTPAFDEDELIPIQLSFIVTHVSDDMN